MSTEYDGSHELSQPLTQVDFGKVENAFRQSLTENQFKRAELAYVVVNHALRLLNCRDPIKPLILLSTNGLINNEKKVGVFSPNGFTNITNDPTIFLFVGKDVLFTTVTSTIPSPDGKLVTLTTTTHNKNSYTNLIEYLATILEETHHFVERSNILGNQLPPGHPDYDLQPHESTAKKFVEENIFEIAATYKEYLKYYVAEAEE